MSTTTQTFANTSGAGLALSNISVVETDVGGVLNYVSPSLGLTLIAGSPFNYVDWTGPTGGIYAVGTSQTIVFSYDVSATGLGMGISALEQDFVPNAVIGDVHLTIQENVYNSANQLVGTTFVDLNNAADPTTLGYASGDIQLSGVYGSLHVQVTLIATVSPTAAAPAVVTFSAVEQGFSLAPVTIHQNNPATFTAHVYLDANADATQNAGDSNLSGITVTLLDSTGTPTGQTAITDVNGNVTFSNLVAGTYSVSIPTPAGDSISTSTNVGTPIAIPAGGTASAELGVYAPATFTTHVYTDANADGVQGAGETNLPGVTVTLLDGAGNATGRTAVTDANGNVSFAGLKPGSYQVAVTTPSGDVTTQLVNVGAVNTLASGGSANAIEGVYVPASLSGHVFLDANADGVQQAGDTNIAGATVQLLDSAGNAIAGKTLLTDANGAYNFTGLKPGTYSVAITAPAGDKFSQVGTNANAALDSIVNTSGKTNAVTLVSGQNTPNQNAAVFAPATFTAHVYTDANADGVQNTGDTNLAGVTVSLLNGNGVATGTTAITDANGNVSFTGLTPGSYQVAVTTPAGDTTTQVLNVSTSNTLVSGGTANAIEGVYVPASLSGHIFLDLNATGVQDNAGDTNIAGVTVQLLDSAGNAIAGKTLLTDANGAYNFAGLKPGSYSVAFTAPAGDVFSQVGTNANAVLDSIVNSAGKTTAVTLTSGTNTPNQNAAVYMPASLSGHIFLDVNATGVQDSASDTNIAGVTVQLLDSAGNAIAGKTLLTDANGAYSFTALKPGTYSVAFTAPTGDVFSQVGTNANAALDSIVNSAGKTSAVTLISGQNTPNQNAAVYVPATLSGHIFLDLNGTGVQDSASDTNIAGVTVQLLDSAGNAIAGKTALTDANGAYKFAGLQPGTYSVAFTAPTGDKFSQVGTNANAALDSIVNSAGKTSAVVLTSGQNVVNQNAAVYLPATFTTHVYLDNNANNTQDTGDANLAGVTVSLLTGAGVATGTTGITDANGNVSFTGLAPGSYEVAVTTPTGDTVTQATNIITANTLVSGGTANSIEGLYAPANTGGGTGAHISVLKLPTDNVITSCQTETYTYLVTNTGTVSVSNLKVVDNHGTTAMPDNVTAKGVMSSNYNVGDANKNGKLDVGETWKFTASMTETGASSGGSCGTVSHSTAGCHIGVGDTAWMSSCFTPTSTANGATYAFKGVKICISEYGKANINVDCPDSYVKFSSSCTKASTVYDDGQNAWITTLPAGQACGKVFLSGVPMTVPYGCNMDNKTVTWSIGQSQNNCGSNSLSWQSQTCGYNDFNQNGHSGSSDYNQIGVKSCDYNSGYGKDGYSSGYCGNYGANNCYGYGGSYGSDSNDCAGTAENQNNYWNCTTGNGYGNGYGNGDGSGYGSGNGCNTGNYSCGYSGNSWYGDCSNYSSSCYGQDYYSNTYSCYNGNSCYGSSCYGYGSGCGYGGYGGGYGSNCEYGYGSGDGSQCSGGVIGTSCQLSSTSAIDTVTATATTSTGATVTATDIKEVQVLAANSNIQQDGTATTASLSAAYGGATKLEFAYNPSDIVSVKQVQAGLATSTGHNANSMAFIEISNSANPFSTSSQIYFQGNVQAGEKIYADSTMDMFKMTPIAASAAHFSTVAGADIYAYVFTSQDAFKAGTAPIQTMAYNTSGSQAMHFGDQIGSLTVVGYVGATGGRLVS